MRNTMYFLTLAVLLGGLGLRAAYAQKGIGDNAGVARQAVAPKIVTLQGTVAAVETGPCKNTTGRAVVGTHFLLKTPDGKTLNVHLGPAPVVESTAKRLAKDGEVKVTAFRTDAMPENHYVAQSLTIGDETVTLRDETLRPDWAGPQPATRGRGAMQGGNGRGQGRGQGLGQGRRVRVRVRDADRDADRGVVKVKGTVEAAEGATAMATVAETVKRAPGGPNRLDPTGHPLRDRATIGARANVSGTPVKVAEGATAMAGDPVGVRVGVPDRVLDAVPGGGKAGVQGVMPDGNADYEAG